MSKESGEGDRLSTKNIITSNRRVVQLLIINVKEGGKAFNKNHKRRVEAFTIKLLMSKEGERGGKPFNKKLLSQGVGG